jgi:hypothetical protein
MFEGFFRGETKAMKVQEATLPERRQVTRPSVPQSASTKERLLVKQAKSRQSSAFGDLYERHRSMVFHTAFRILRNQQDAEDAVQRSFQRAFVNRESFRGDLEIFARMRTSGTQNGRSWFPDRPVQQPDFASLRYYRSLTLSISIDPLRLT